MSKSKIPQVPHLNCPVGANQGPEFLKPVESWTSGIHTAEPIPQVGLPTLAAQAQDIGGSLAALQVQPAGCMEHLCGLKGKEMDAY